VAENVGERLLNDSVRGAADGDRQLLDRAEDVEPRRNSGLAGRLDERLEPLATE
jgi:hypothetical protein